jgi:hypothetical protein
MTITRTGFFTEPVRFTINPVCTRKRRASRPRGLIQ